MSSSLSPESAARSPPASTHPSSSPADLARLLSDAYVEAEKLRQDLRNALARAERAESLALSYKQIRQALPLDAPANNGSHQPTQESAMKLLAEYEQRAFAAEAARDTADAHRACMADNWAQLTTHLTQLEAAAVDARMGFERVIASRSPVNMSFDAIPALGSGSRGRSRMFQSSAPFPSLPLPPHPSGNRGRPRTPSVDGYGQPPPSKRSRGEYDPNAMYVDKPRHIHSPQQQQQMLAPRMILPPSDHAFSSSKLQATASHSNSNTHLHPSSRHHRSSHRTSSSRRPTSRSHSRSSSVSSSASLSVDEMLLAATTDGQNGAGQDQHQNPMPQAQHQHQQHQSHAGRSKRRALTSPGSQMYPQHLHPQQAYEHHDRRSYPAEYHQSHAHAPHGQGQDQYHPSPKQQPMTGPTGAAEPLQQPGQTGAFHTHVFTPPVTGAPVKKAKFPSSSVSLTSPPPPPPPAPAPVPPVEAPPPTVYPPTNEQGQRICRVCGMPGRYKDGKCVEKWGPGPMGPGTVCDRCRKKAKRVERRGTMESQQQAALLAAQTSSFSHLTPQQQAQARQQTIHRTDTLPAHSHHSQSQSQTQYSQSQSQSQSQPQPQSQTQYRSEGTPKPATSLSPNGNGNGSTHAPHPRPAVLPSNEEFPTSAMPRGGAGGTARTQGSRPSSRAAAGGRGTPVGGEKKTMATSALGRGPAPTAVATAVAGTKDKRASRSPGDMDVDADGDAESEVEEDAEIEAEIVGLVASSSSPEVSASPARKRAGAGSVAMEVDGETKVETELEMELVEAVDAAEAKSVGSSAGRGKEEEEE